ncbi:RNA polymerase, sigma-24 subunit, ECF subfamily [Spirochaeta thermophila DSM 6578]|uniref:RNA polymerase, sigma-24 subunit, ECF subfamily n=1 Tax=Winmispira thermophila (strain ATCC 700085 / DSM 6578 / Z-1203) TaxID=869211 RepID=G0GD11_WINT7|nr:sigma-70 family RNA polymerase sigma factor [Spirochaeta thermophila]AEJ61303.1 RNA polymerase, sigma-24 subunit, ECF subfamily [Spirochaeta thermophila DSM 6578]
MVVEQDRRLSHEREGGAEGLVDAARNGDHTAFRRLVEMYKDRVARTIVGILGPVPEVEDIGQEVFLRFYKSLPKFRGEASVGTYLTRITINLCLNERKRRFRAPLPLETAKEPEMDPPDERTITTLAVHETLADLSVKHRVILTLFYLNELSVEEISRSLEIPVGTVLSRLSRARDAFEKAYTRRMGETHETA